MPRKKMTDEEKKAFGEKMKLAREKKKLFQEPAVKVETQDLPVVPFGEAPVDVQETKLDMLQRQLDEVMETNALLKAAFLNNQGNQNSQGTDNVSIGRGNKVIGEVDKYLVDPNEYPDPTKRLADEPRLAALAFKFNYDLDYEFKISNYETKTGLNMREPDFLITLYRIVLDEQGNPLEVIDPKTNKPAIKRYIARRLSFKEDPQAALVIARENNLDVDKSDERAFLNEMRYLRVRDWLFDYFWPVPSQSASRVQEEVIGGSIVQVSLKNSVEPSSPDFDQINKKIAF